MDMRGPVRPSATRLSTHSSTDRATAYGADDPGSNPGGCAMGIRVIRILEYEYENEEVASQDMARWTHSAPAGRTDIRMKSCVLPFDAIEWEGAER